MSNEANTTLPALAVSRWVDSCKAVEYDSEKHRRRCWAFHNLGDSDVAKCPCCGMTINERGTITHSSNGAAANGGIAAKGGCKDHLPEGWSCVYMLRRAKTSEGDYKQVPG